MKKVVSQVKTIKDDFSDMALNHRNKPPSEEAQSAGQAEGADSSPVTHYENHFVVDDLEVGTLVRKTAVHVGLLLDDGLELASRLNPVRRFTSKAASSSTGEYNPGEDHHDIRYRQQLNIEAHDGITLSANLFAPAAVETGQTFPAIVFINSWCMDKHQYLLQARRFARNGYLVLSYSARGWGQSGGVVDVGGPQDMRDISTVLDWLIGNAPVQPDKIGFSGISYGSGLSLLGTAHDKRIATAVCMSGWADLFASFFSEQTPRQFFAKVLVGSSKLTAKTDDTLDYMLHGLLHNRHIDEVQAWGRERSPATYIDKYNRRKPPIYLVQNFQDELFYPNSVLEFFSRLKGPKRIDLNKGTHGSAELSGIIGLKNHLWLQTHAWFDHWLKGVSNDIMLRDPISCQFEQRRRLHLSMGKHEGSRHTLQNWESTQQSITSFYPAPPAASGERGLLASKSDGIGGQSSIDSGLGTSRSTAGIPLLSSTRNAHLNMPLKLNLSKIPPRLAVVYETQALTRRWCILGTPQLTLNIETTRPQVQLIAYLYESDAQGRGRLITHGPMTRHLEQPNLAFEVSFEMMTTCYELQEGHHIVLVIDTSDLQYQSPTKDDFTVTFHYGVDRPPRLDIPMIPAGEP